jgi:integrase
VKLPNGYGSVTKLSGNRRKPYVARISGDPVYDEQIKGYKPTRAVLGYYVSKKEALNALAEYNMNPFSIDKNNITFKEVYDLWKKNNYKNLSESSITVREAALKHCKMINDIKVRDITTNMLTEVINNCPFGSSTKKNIKTVMHTVFQYALQNNLVSKDYSEFINIEYSEPVIEREIFTDEQIDALWGISDNWDAKILLILIYTGMRVNELLKNTHENCNLEERYIYVPKELAKNNTSVRYVPIHDKIYDFVKYFYDFNKENLIVNSNGNVVLYNNFVNRNLKRLNDCLKANHRFHDTRHTFVTLAHRYKLDDLCLKKIVGHSPSSITQKVYTHITIQDMLHEVNKIK